MITGQKQERTMTFGEVEGRMSLGQIHIDRGDYYMKDMREQIQYAISQYEIAAKWYSSVVNGDLDESRNIFVNTHEHARQQLEYVNKKLIHLRGLQGRLQTER